MPAELCKQIGTAGLQTHFHLPVILIFASVKRLISSKEFVLETKIFSLYKFLRNVFNISNKLVSQNIYLTLYCNNYLMYQSRALWFLHGLVYFVLLIMTSNTNLFNHLNDGSIVWDKPDFINVHIKQVPISSHFCRRWCHSTLYPQFHRLSLEWCTWSRASTDRPGHWWMTGFQHWRLWAGYNSFMLW